MHFSFVNRKKCLAIKLWNTNFYCRNFSSFLWIVRNLLFLLRSHPVVLTAQKHEATRQYTNLFEGQHHKVKPNTKIKSRSVSLSLKWIHMLSDSYIVLVWLAIYHLRKQYLLWGLYLCECTLPKSWGSFPIHLSNMLE